MSWQMNTIAARNRTNVVSSLRSMDGLSCGATTHKHFMDGKPLLSSFKTSSRHGCLTVTLPSRAYHQYVVGIILKRKSDEILCPIMVAALALKNAWSHFSRNVWECFKALATRLTKQVWPQTKAEPTLSTGRRYMTSQNVSSLFSAL